MLREKILSGQGGVKLYGFTPPKAGNSSDKNFETAARQTERINTLGADGIVLYDLQEEPGRVDVPRPFPFLPTVEPLSYAREFLSGVKIPKIIYRCVAKDTEADFERWTQRLVDPGFEDLAIFVGAATGRRPGEPERLNVKNACRIAATTAPALCFGGVAIAERHLSKGDEDKRLFEKNTDGCGFFISQTVYDVKASKSLIADYAARFAEAGKKAPLLVMSFSPCGSAKTLDFMKWLGVRFSSELESDLKSSSSILDRSIRICTEIAQELSAFARERGVPVGMNVESVSIRKEEIDASCSLFHELADGPFSNAGF